MLKGINSIEYYDEESLPFIAHWRKNTMTADEAVEWAEKLWESGFDDFNGCSFSPDLGIKRACNIHDTLWAFLPVHRHRCDAIFRELILRRGGYRVICLFFDKIVFRVPSFKKIKYFFVAWFYWATVRFSWFSGAYKFITEVPRHFLRLMGK